MIVREADSAESAMQLIRGGDPFDLAILDMAMPEKDGGQLAAEIRQLRDAQSLPLVLLSSMGRRETGPNADHFVRQLSKPLKPSQLFDSLVEVLGGERTAAVAVAAPKTQDPEMAQRLPLRILLAEDNAVNQKLAQRLLGQLGYRADVAGNGLEAIEALERQPYDVILMDVQMPEMDGFEASRQICQRWRRPERPTIIAITANAMQGDREACLEAGMDDYISKPIRVNELVAALGRCAPHVERGEQVGTGSN
jgi:CheY-like chemotaxis protein